jgi:hypothetical protein
MQSWIGAVNDQEGHAFNAKVAERFRELGWNARDTVQMSEFGRSDLGDCDVLAWRTDRATVFAAECKTLKSALSIGEVTEQIKRFRGQSKDEMEKHLARLHFLRENQPIIIRALGIAGFELRVRPLLVTNTIVPMQFLSDLPISADDIVPFAELASVAII